MYPTSCGGGTGFEFGTALRGTSPIGHPGEGASGHTYEIDPVHAMFLRWPNARVPNTKDGARIQLHVDHPGIRPRRFVSLMVPTILDQAAIDLATAFHKGRYTDVKQALLKQTMPFALNKLTESLAEQAPGTRDDGKLGGEKAADVFRAEAEIEDASI